jgi:hypothetical protein
MPRRSRKPAPLARPGLWWRAPLAAKELAGLPDDEAHVLIVQARQLAVAKLQDQIRTLRKFSRAFSAAHGFALDSKKIVRLHPAKLKQLRDAARQLAYAQARPHILFVAKGSAQRAAAARLGGEIVPEQYVYVFHPSAPDKTKAHYDPKTREIVLTATVKKGVLYDILYKMPRRPKTWKQVRKFTLELKKRGMKHGHYRLYTDLYGPIGTTYSLDVLEDGLDEFFAMYSRFMATTVLGWLWMSSSVQKARSHMRRDQTLAEKFQEGRALIQQQRDDRIKRRLGIKTPKRRALDKKKKILIKKAKRIMTPKQIRQSVAAKKRKRKKKQAKRKK